jgi:hypothetical protein
MTLHLKGHKLGAGPAFVGAMLALTWAFFGYDLWYGRPNIIIDEPATSKEIAQIKKPIQEQLDAVTRQRDAALSEIADLKRQGKEEGQPRPPTPPVPAPVALPYELSEAQIKDLADKLFKIKNLLAPSISIQRIMLDQPSVGLGFQLGRAFDRAGITPNYNWSHPNTPNDTGVRIRVANIQQIPDGAKQFALALKNVGNVNSYFETLSGVDPKSFIIFIGPKP